ncbi:MAG: transposase, partial [Lachnospiraceae bacterium]|nr:transposase [Lachnospiraceae bacterium]
MVFYSRVICMPRQARTKSLSNIYHIMMRGINKQVIFEDDADRRHFVTILGECKEVSGFKLHAFCLMPNHIHLLIEPTGEEPLEIIFKRIGSRYATWYNKKHHRVGHLFQDRFRSENVETEQYYRTVLRYILQNPMKAGMEKEPGVYRWSSYLAYEKGGGLLTDTGYAEKLFGSREVLIDFVKQSNDDQAMDEADNQWHVVNDEAKEIFLRVTNCDSPEDYKRISLPMRREYIKDLYIQHLSIRQISDLTGLPKSTVYDVVRKIE